MAQSSNAEDDDEFWGRPSARQALEVGRQVRKERYAIGWRRNLVGLLIVIALALGIFVLMR